jgi:DNA polymerase III gamma/tau subunit
MAQQAQALGASLPDLEAAIQALQNSQPDAFLRDMNAALNELENLQALVQAMSQAQKMAAQQQAKTLADQLKQGQFQAARETLDRMAEQLKKGEITQEQLEKMLSEVSEACKSGDKFGKVGECLGKASNAMKAGNQGEGGQQLAAASEELQRLLDQMGDMEALQASLDALQRAQMALSQCKSWGQCNNPGSQGKRGNRAGLGAGSWDQTWAPQGSAYLFYPTMTEGSGQGLFQPPGTASQAPNQEGNGELAAAQNPTKLQGRINPDGPMPSITLKGVSIKGTSKVAVQEAMAAAQSDARAAISDEKVPRAYRGAVRDYFDDLKE